MNLKFLILYLKIFIFFLVDTANIHIMSDKNIVVAFYDPSDLTDLITVSMHYSYTVFKPAVSLQMVKNCVFHG